MFQIYNHIKRYIHGRNIYPHSLLMRNKKNDKLVYNYLIELLSDVHDLLDKHQIRYFISDGTLLGAYRSNNFIDGDDDIDIRVYKKDWNKYCKLIQKLKHKYNIESSHNNKWHQIHCKFKTPAESLHMDIVKSDFVFEELWINVDDMFIDSTEYIFIKDKKVRCPHKKYIIPYLEKSYGKTWKTPLLYSHGYRNYIMSLNILLLIVIGILLLLTMKYNYIIFIPIVILLLIFVILSFKNNF